MNQKIESLPIHENNIHGRAARKAMLAYAKAIAEDATTDIEVGYSSRLYQMVAEASEGLLAKQQGNVKPDTTAIITPAPEDHEH